MFNISHLFYLIVVIVFGEVESSYVVINWNISTDRGNSHFEREYNYPMYEDIAPAPCDLTDSCDIFCPQDPDCDESQKISFSISKPSSQCDGPLSVFDCGCDKFEKPEWFPLLCYIYKNPIYLGMFYKTPKKIEKYATLKNLIGKKQQNLFNHEEINEKLINKLSYQYASPIMTFIPMSEAFPSVSPLMIKIPLNDFSHACESKPVRYGFNTSTACHTKINQDLCENGYALSVLPFLVQGGNQSTNSDIPIVLKDLNYLKGVKTEVEIKCVELNSKVKKLKKMDLSYFQQKNFKPCSEFFDNFQTVFANEICRNVLVYLQYEFTLNGSDIIKLNVEYGLGDVPIPNTNEIGDVVSKYIYLQQKFGVTFFDIMTNNNKNESVSELNRGYFMGEELNFGYRHVENSSVSWEKGVLGVFRSGKSCDDFSPITFGFDYSSACQIEKKFSNCSHLRDAVEKKFENILKGDSLGVWGDFRPPYDNSAPLLRSFTEFRNISSENYTGCSIPVVQDIHIQYTSIPVEDGRVVHRVLGVRVDRSFRNVSLDSPKLTSRVFFSFVSSAKDKMRSKFWERMLSPESSENAWLYILNGFDDVTTNEREEISFWCLLLALLVFAGIACVGLDVNFVVTESGTPPFWPTGRKKKK